MIDAQEITLIEENLVRAVAGSVTDVSDGDWGDRNWVHIFVDFEIAQIGARSSSIAFTLAHRPQQSLEKVAFRLTPEAKQLFGTLAESMRQPGANRWSSTQLRIERDGSFAFDFSYDQPWRLGGNLIDKRFENYLELWLTTPPGGLFAQALQTESPAGLWRRLRSVF